MDDNCPPTLLFPLIIPLIVVLVVHWARQLIHSTMNKCTNVCLRSITTILSSYYPVSPVPQSSSSSNRITTVSFLSAYFFDKGDNPSPSAVLVELMSGWLTVKTTIETVLDGFICMDISGVLVS